MILIQCPECKCEVDEEVKICEKCGFDLFYCISRHTKRFMMQKYKN